MAIRIVFLNGSVFRYFKLIMRKYFFPYIATIIILIVIVACNSQTEPANAKPRIPEEKKFGSIKLKYEDTTQPEFRRMVRRLDSFYAIQTRTGFNGSVLVGYKGKVLYERYYGLANRETGLKLNPNSAVQLASVSKTFLKTENLVVSLLAYDILNQNINNNRMVMDNRIIDTKTRVIRQYFLAKALFKFNSQKTKEEDNDY